MAWHAHSNILLQCSVTAWSLQRYFKIVILKVCCMWESSEENNCLRTSGTQASIFFKVFQTNSMWNQVCYESIVNKCEVKIWPPHDATNADNWGNKWHILPTMNFTYVQITHMSQLSCLLSSCKIFLIWLPHTNTEKLKCEETCGLEFGKHSSVIGNQRVSVPGSLSAIRSLFWLKIWIFISKASSTQSGLRTSSISITCELVKT